MYLAWHQSFEDLTTTAHPAKTVTCIKNGCDYQLDLDGQVTCSVCGAMDDDKHVISNKDFENQMDFE